jgi:hypothetical protein
VIEVRTKMQKPQLRWPANAIQCLIETIAEVKLAERCWQKNVLQGPIECHAKGQSLQTPRPADVAATITRRISHAQVLQYTAGKPIFCRATCNDPPDASASGRLAS